MYDFGRFGSVWVILCSLSLSLSFAQYDEDIEQFISQKIAENDIVKQLPPLDSLLTIAIKVSPELQYQYADERYFKARHRLSQTRWLDYFYVEGVYNYGIFDNLTTQQLSGQPNVGQSLLSTTQSRYSFGPSIKIPVSAILNRKNDIRAAKAEKERSLGGRDIIIAKVREETIKRYNDVVKNHRMLLAIRVMIDTYSIQTKRANKEFRNGIIDIAEFTRLQQMHHEALIAMESQKSDYQLSVKLLEEITGAKLKL